ncbi:MAG: S41 family peptidase [Planctomycetota bacterium]
MMILRAHLQESLRAANSSQRAARRRAGRLHATARALLPAALLGVTAAAQDLTFESDPLGEPPAGWRISGVKPESFEARVASSPDHRRALRIERVGPGGFIIMSARSRPIAAGTVAIRVRAMVHADRVQSRISGFFVTLRDARGQVVATDNMNGRPVTGSRPWGRVETTLPVYPGATQLEFGPTLAGRGGVLWLDDFRVEALTANDIGTPSVEAQSFALRALETLREHALRSDSIDWDDARARLLAGLLGAQSNSATYDALRDIARYVDRHTKFYSPEEMARKRATSPADAEPIELEMPSGRLLPQGVGYVLVPGVHVLDDARLQTFADALSTLVFEIEEAGATRWIIDLRRNGGGSMYPMLAGLEPLLGTGDLGYFVTNDDQATPWYIVPVEERSTRPGVPVEGIGSVRRRLRAPEAPVAVLIGPGTTSSGEVVALSFRGRPDTALVGSPTGGFTTGNQLHELPGGAVLAITTSVYADRSLRRYGGPVHPDVTVDQPLRRGTQPGGDDDPGIQAARDWLNSHSRRR